MSTINKKFVSAALTATTALWMSGAMMLVPVAHAQSSAELQAQIAALLAQIQQLQAQLNTGGTTPSSYNYTRDLTVGSRGDDVSALQQTLINKGYLTAVSAPTGYFGSATRAALAAWQAANGISPTAGYFGPKTRAAMNAMVVTPPGPPGTPPTPPPVVPATGLSVRVAANNTPAGSLISSSASAAARVPVLTVDLTAGISGPVTVNDLKFTKGGVLSDTSISSAYLVENGKVLAQYSSLTGGVITFSGLGLSIGAGQTRNVTLAIDPATGLSAGNTVSFMVKSASDVVAVDNNNTAVTASGAFPLSGNIFTVTSVSNPSIASLTIASSSVGTSVYAGTQAVLVSQWTLTGSNSPLDLKGIEFKVVGSANKSDLKNVKLFINGTQVGPTLAQVASNGSAYFDLSSAPARINTGSGNMQVYADVMGSPSYNFQFELLNGYDVLAIDTQYGVPVSVTINGGAGIQISILQGTLTVSLDTPNTPTGNIAKGGSGTPLAKFKIYAAGEPVKVKFLTFRLDFTGTTTTLSSLVKNIVLVDDAGNQVGTTINTPPTTNSCDVSGTGTTAGYNAAGTQYTDCFGTSASNINYTIPANMTRILTLRADVQSGAGFSTVTANLLASTSNLQGQTSSQLSSSGSVTGSSLTLAANALTVARNSAVSTQTYAKGVSGARIGSYQLTASSAEGANLNSVTITTSASSTNFQNLKLCVGGTPTNTCPTQVGITQSTLSASAAYTFSGNLNVPAGQTKIVDVVADILSGTTANTYTAVTTLSGCSGSGSVTFTSITCSSTTGQDVVVAGQASVTVSSDSGQAAADQLVMGSSGNSLATFRFTETSNIEDVKITDLYVSDLVAATSSVKSAFSNLTLWAPGGAMALGTAGAATGNASATTQTYYYKFTFSSPVVVPKSNSTLLVLKGDVASYASSGATDNTTHVFRISTSTDSAVDTVAEVVIALGNTSNATSSVTLSSAAGNAMTVLRSKIAFSATPLGATSGRTRTTADNLASLTFAADPAGTVAINSVIVTFNGTLPTNANFLDGVTLLDENNTALGSGNTTSSACDAVATACTKTFNLGSTTNGQAVSGGSSRVWTLRVDSTRGKAAAANIAQTLSATINALTDIRFTDALDTAAATAVSLPTKVLVPINLNSVSYSAGT